MVARQPVMALFVIPIFACAAPVALPDPDDASFQLPSAQSPAATVLAEVMFLTEFAMLALSF